MSRRGQADGFTLIEVLVALGIVAIALTAGLKATTALTNNAMRQSDILLAHICAENELIKARLSRQMPTAAPSSFSPPPTTASASAPFRAWPTTTPSTAWPTTSARAAARSP